ncbi:hypothetical protein D3C81_1556150 [compost metagenome]
MTLHCLMDVAARGHLPAQHGTPPRHCLIDIGVQGFGHEELSSLANSLVDDCLLPPMIRVRLAGSRPSSEPKVTNWRMDSFAAVSAGFFIGLPWDDSTTMPNFWTASSDIRHLS